MEKHLYVYYGEFLGEFGLSVMAGSGITTEAIEACTESFTTENGTYHYQAEYRKEAFAYLEKQGVKVPITN